MQPTVIVSPASAASLRAARPLFLVRMPQHEQVRKSADADSYWPSHFMHAFTLQMAAHGHCVSASMMLGDKGYAREQLDYACQLDDDALRSLVVELMEYFDVPVSSAPLGTPWINYQTAGASHADARA